MQKPAKSKGAAQDRLTRSQRKAADTMDSLGVELEQAARIPDLTKRLNAELRIHARILKLAKRG